jgi:hypothetical protein
LGRRTPGSLAPPPLAIVDDVTIVDDDGGAPLKPACVAVGVKAYGTQTRAARAPSSNIKDAVGGGEKRLARQGGGRGRGGGALKCVRAKHTKDHTALATSSQTNTCITPAWAR